MKQLTGKSNPDELFQEWLQSFEVHWKQSNPYWVGAGYDPKSYLASDDEFFTHDYVLREKHLAEDNESTHETFYITGYDLKQAFLAGFKAGKVNS